MTVGSGPYESTYSHAFQAVARGQKTRTYATEESMRHKIQEAANATGTRWRLFQHHNESGWDFIGEIRPEKK